MTGSITILPNLGQPSNDRTRKFWPKQAAALAEAQPLAAYGGGSGGASIVPPVAPPPPLPEAPPSEPWTTHAAAEAWLDQFTERTGIGSPLDWSPIATLAQKFAAALQLWQDWEDSQ